MAGGGLRWWRQDNHLTYNALLVFHHYHDQPAPIVQYWHGPVEVPATAPSGSEVTSLTRDQIGKVGEVPVSTGAGQSTKAVTVLQPDPATEQRLVAGFDVYEKFTARGYPPPKCPGYTVPGTVHLATVNASGVSWAISAFAASPECTQQFGAFQ